MANTTSGTVTFDKTFAVDEIINEASGVTGDVKATLPACTNTDSATITCEWIKVY